MRTKLPSMRHCTRAVARPGSVAWLSIERNKHTRTHWPYLVSRGVIQIKAKKHEGDDREDGLDDHKLNHSLLAPGPS